VSVVVDAFYLIEHASTASVAGLCTSCGFSLCRSSRALSQAKRMRIAMRASCLSLSIMMVYQSAQHFDNGIHILSKSTEPLIVMDVIEQSRMTP